MLSNTAVTPGPSADARREKNRLQARKRQGRYHERCRINIVERETTFHLPQTPPRSSHSPMFPTEDGEQSTLYRIRCSLTQAPSADAAPTINFMQESS